MENVVPNVVTYYRQIEAYALFVTGKQILTNIAIL
jgi:hypothetical protein